MTWCDGDDTKAKCGECAGCLREKLDAALLQVESLKAAHENDPLFDKANVEIRTLRLQVSELKAKVDKCRCCGDPLVCPKRFEDMNRQNEELRSLLNCAVGMLKDWGSYAPDWAKEKHDFNADVNKLLDGIAMGPSCVTEKRNHEPGKFPDKAVNGCKCPCHAEIAHDGVGYPCGVDECEPCHVKPPKPRTIYGG